MLILKTPATMSNLRLKTSGGSGHKRQALLQKTSGGSGRKRQASPLRLGYARKNDYNQLKKPDKSHPSERSTLKMETTTVETH